MLSAVLFTAHTAAYSLLIRLPGPNKNAATLSIKLISSFSTPQITILLLSAASAAAQIAANLVLINKLQHQQCNRLLLDWLDGQQQECSNLEHQAHHQLSSSTKHNSVRNQLH